MSTQISSSTQGFTYTPPEFSFLDFAQPTTQAKPQGKKASQSKIAQSNNKSKLDIKLTVIRTSRAKMLTQLIIGV